MRAKQRCCTPTPKAMQPSHCILQLRTSQTTSARIFQAQKNLAARFGASEPMDEHQILQLGGSSLALCQVTTRPAGEHNFFIFFLD